MTLAYQALSLGLCLLICKMRDCRLGLQTCLRELGSCSLTPSCSWSTLLLSDILSSAHDFMYKSSVAPNQPANQPTLKKASSEFLWHYHTMILLFHLIWGIDKWLASWIHYFSESTCHFHYRGFSFHFPKLFSVLVGGLSLGRMVQVLKVWGLLI